MKTTKSARKRGFILMYVVALLAAISLILLELGRMQSPSPMFMEKQVSHVLERREGFMLLDFVLAGTVKQKLPVDPRYVQFKRILAARPRPESEMEVQLAWLKSMLAQLNFKIDDGRAKPPESDKPGSVTETAEVVEDKVDYEGKGVLFVPRRDPYRIKLGEIEYEIRIMPGNALPNLNSIGYEPLWRYLELLGVPSVESRPLAAALIDWRDADEFRTEGVGAESDYYYGIRPPYSPRNLPVRSWQELNFVRGMAPERVRLLRDGFMLGRPELEGVSPDYAGPEIFTALTGLKPATVKAILKEYGKLDDKQAVVDDILLSEDSTAFDRAVSWKEDASLLRIQIRSPNNNLTADYDTKAKRVVAWW